MNVEIKTETPIFLFCMKIFVSKFWYFVFAVYVQGNEMGTHDAKRKISAFNGKELL
jgi:hypothetical protein